MSSAASVAIINLFLLLMLGVGLYHGRRVDLAGFTTERDRVGLWRLVGTFVGTSVGGGIVVGMVTMGHEAGTVGLVVSVSYLVGFLVLAWASRHIRSALRGTPGTLMDFISSRFGARAGNLATVVFSLVLFLFLSAQYVALAAFLEFFFGLEFAIGLALSCTYLIVYTTLGGLRSVLATDLLQLACITATSVWLLRPVVRPSAISQIAELPAELLNGQAYGIVFLVGAALFLWPTLLVRVDIWQRIVSARDDRTARTALVISGLVLLVFMVLYTTMGMVARSAFPAVQSRTAAFVFVQDRLHAAGVLLCFIGLLAAIMSSADSILNVLAICLVKLTAHGRKAQAWSDESEERRTLRMVRVATVVAGAVSLAVAFALPDIVDLNVAGLSALLVFLPSVVSGLRHSESSRAAGFWSAAAGTATVMLMLPLAPKMAFLPGLLVSCVVFAAVTLADRMKRGDRGGITRG